MKSLAELIGYVPEEAEKNLPPGVGLEEYWENNDAFLNAYDEGSSIVLTYRCKYSQKKVKVSVNDFEWYGYIHRKDLKKIPAYELKRAKKNFGLRIQPIKGYYRLFVNNDSINEMYDDYEDERIQLKNMLKEYEIEPLEWDLKNYKRFCIDNLIKVDTNYRYIFLDIETDDRNDGIVVGRDMILSCATVDQDGKKKFFIADDDSPESERDLIKKIWDHIDKYDVVVGWNSSNFDLPYLKERHKKYFNYYPSMKDIAHIDFMKRFQKLFSYDLKIRSWSLDFISNYFLGRTKVKHKEGIYEMFMNNRKLLRKYNLNDSLLLAELEEKLKVLGLILLECEWCGTFPTKFYISELLDNYILRYTNKKGVHFKSVNFGDKRFEDEEVVGGLVLDPEKGLHEEVRIVDFKSLYPTVIMTWNISLDTFVKTAPPEDEMDNYIRTVNGFWTKKNKHGMLPEIIERLLDERKQYKVIQAKAVRDSQEYKAAYATQLVIKELSNSLYGIMAQKGNRYYDKNVAESITKAGHYFIGLTSEVMKRLGYHVVYGDTDSCFIRMDKNVDMDKVLAITHVEFTKRLKQDFNIDKSAIVLEYEKYYKRILLIHKKQYVGRLIELDGAECDEVYGRGLDFVKKDTIEYGRRLQLELITKLLYEDNFTLKECVKYVEDELHKFENGRFDIKEITISNRITRHPSKYKVKLVHVKVAQQMIEDKKEFYVGMFIPYVITESVPKQEGVHVDDYKGEYDRRYYWDIKIYGLLYRILTVTHPEYDWDQYMYEILRKRKKKLEQFNKWLKDPKKKREAIVKKIQDDKVLSQKQKNQLIGAKKKVFKLKVSSSEKSVKEKISITKKQEQ